MSSSAYRRFLGHSSSRLSAIVVSMGLAMPTMVGAQDDPAPCVEETRGAPDAQFDRAVSHIDLWRADEAGNRAAGQNEYAEIFLKPKLRFDTKTSFAPTTNGFLLQINKTRQADPSHEFPTGPLAWKEWKLFLPRILKEPDQTPARRIALYVYLGDTLLHGGFYSLTDDSAEAVNGEKPTREFVIVRRNDETIGESEFDHRLAEALTSEKSDAPFKISIAPDHDPDYLISAIIEREALKAAIASGDRNLAALRDEARTGACEPGTPNVDCFMTTAACDTLGLDDDCWELRTLRRFRDDYMANATEGSGDIATYYATAPDIVRKISTRPDAPRVWKQLYGRYILPSAIMARLGLNRMAHQHYRRMMEFVG
ncbi:CFI-box-CTERM domain-containing protein [Parvularcula sp. LCG005]|uniref:CFI-box-CTERM domain-containing protein n=1 Tax=Parvularcula sp. LCG005 TaxID=3078805 RepID=UPI0029439CB9|nr:CFI-box-CTERM domain-containing protein [Parvularcula sp. LCG005]WOI52006.1 CFI-box-CTERM domain-containing protein [Parvularcula sp. LCG005]